MSLEYKWPSKESGPLGITPVGMFISEYASSKGNKD